LFTLIQISSKKYPKLKEVDDVLGGKEAWENVDSTEGLLLGKPKTVYYLVIQDSKFEKTSVLHDHVTCFLVPQKTLAGC